MKKRLLGWLEHLPTVVIFGSFSICLVQQLIPVYDAVVVKHKFDSAASQHLFTSLWIAQVIFYYHMMMDERKQKRSAWNNYVSHQMKLLDMVKINHIFAQLLQRLDPEILEKAGITIKKKPSNPIEKAKKV